MLELATIFSKQNTNFHHCFNGFQDYAFFMGWPITFVISVDYIPISRNENLEEFREIETIVGYAVEAC